MFLLIRHALCDPVGHSIAGRQPGIHLNNQGQRQAQNLAERLAGVALAGLYSSPLERALETARPIGLRQGLEVELLPGFTEVNFGEWTGKPLAELDRIPAWRRFNEFRSGTRIPAGENMSEVLTRSLGELERLRQRHPTPDALVGIVSHGDVLRMLVAHALGMSPDLLQRLELSPAGISLLQLEDYGARILLLNSAERWPEGVPLRSSE